jgi:hypothetical protein
MSDEKNEKNENVLQEKVPKMVVTPEDILGAFDFWTHFEVPPSPELKAAVEAFAANPCLETQQEVKLQLCKGVGFTEHEAFKDDMFKEITEECREVVYDMSFDKQLENTLSDDPNKKTK